MVLDLRRHSKSDLLSYLSLVSINSFDEGGYRPIRLLRFSRYVNYNQDTIFSLVNYAGKVEGDQFSCIGLVNHAREVGINQVSFLGLVNYAREVGGKQVGLFSLVNYAREVEGDQGCLLGLVNCAGEVGGDQIGGIIGLVNYAREVEGDQGCLLGLVNCAGEVGGDQIGGVSLVNIQTKNRKARQRGCLLRYNPLEKIGFGSSVWSKIEKAEMYLDSKKEEFTHEDYKSFLESLVREGPTLRKRITGHWTYSDILSRQAKRRLRSLSNSQREQHKDIEVKIINKEIKNKDKFKIYEYVGGLRNE
ncbi:MAG: hypothetical protein KatS3mg001_196 [Candidatus Pacearchaeota archaeon]|nr:MAG: hypothetical protein KatS3mg001_196 [Candidatus Pacearchaeota archaeon]